VHAMLVPSKGSVLADKLPAYAAEYDSSYLAGEINDGNIFDLEAILKKHADEYIYYKTDHHWTTLGAFYAYREYCRMCGFAEPKISDYTQTVVSDEFLGSSYDKVQLSQVRDEITRWDINALTANNSTDTAIAVTDNVTAGNATTDHATAGNAPTDNVTADNAPTEHATSYNATTNHDKKHNSIYSGLYNSLYDDSALSEKDKYQYFLGGNEAFVHIHTQAAGGRTIYILKDSYCNCFVGFLTRDYEDIYISDLRYTNDMAEDIMTDIEEENKIDDVLVMYNREKFMRDNNMWKLEIEEADVESDADKEDNDREHDNTYNNVDNTENDMNTDLNIDAARDKNSDDADDDNDDADNNDDIDNKDEIEDNDDADDYDDEDDIDGTEDSDDGEVEEENIF